MRNAIKSHIASPLAAREIRRAVGVTEVHMRAARRAYPELFANSEKSRKAGSSQASGHKATKKR